MPFSAGTSRVGIGPSSRRCLRQCSDHCSRPSPPPFSDESRIRSNGTVDPTIALAPPPFRGGPLCLLPAVPDERRLAEPRPASKLDMDLGPGRSTNFWPRILLSLVFACTFAYSAFYAAGWLRDDSSIPVAGDSDGGEHSRRSLGIRCGPAPEVLTVVSISTMTAGRLNGWSRLPRLAGPSTDREQLGHRGDRHHRRLGTPLAAGRSRNASLGPTNRSRHLRRKLRRRVHVLPVAQISTGHFILGSNDASQHWSGRSDPGHPLDSLKTLIIKSDLRIRKTSVPKTSRSSKDNEVIRTAMDPKSAPTTAGPGVRDWKFPWHPKNQTARRRLPQALIIGVKKGGTRALLEFIRLHPDVKAVGPETHFFDRHYHKGLEWYRSQMPPTFEGQLTMEKTPSYFVTREVPRRIRSMARDVKLLVVVRDPVTRAISDYAQTVSKRRHMKSFDELTFLNNATGLVDTSWGAIRIGVYAKHLEHWLHYFPLGQFHFVSGERLIKDPAGEMAKVQDFLRVRRIVTDGHFYFNETKGFPCVKKPEGGGGRPRCLGKTKGRTHPNVENSTIHNLREFFRPFNMKFYQMTGVDFGWP